tara:strand:+ start:229 stop:402 length:174 start_codon:yes stop_codon:yes gene_type:complete
MKETIDSISDEMWEYIKQLFEEKMLEFGVEEEREKWTRAEISTKLIMKLEDDYLDES